MHQNGQTTLPPITFHFLCTLLGATFRLCDQSPVSIHIFGVGWGGLVVDTLTLF